MEHIADMIGTVCVSVIAATIIYNFGSFPSMERIIRFVVSLYIISNSINILSGNRINFTYDFATRSMENYEISENFNTYVMSETELNLEEIIKNRLESKNISYKDIDLHILEQNSILTVDKITVVCSNSDVSEVMKAIEDMITKETMIIIGE